MLGTLPINQHSTGTRKGDWLAQGHGTCNAGTPRSHSTCMLLATTGLHSPNLHSYYPKYLNTGTRVVCYVVVIASRSKALYIFLFFPLSCGLSLR